MISPRCFEESWIREQAAALRARDLRTLEKNILALELVSRLRREGLDFIFKGGTSLALFFDPVRRLSIDVDILSLEPIERLKAVLDQATTDRPPFTGYEHQERRDREAPPTVHFQIAESRLAAGRAALVAELIRQGQTQFDLPAFLAAEIDLNTIRDANLDAAWTNLNRLKKTDPKAFECWHQAQSMRQSTQ